MATLYATEQGARIEKEYRRILVTKEDEVLLALPAARVDHVVLVGRVGVTTPALLSLLTEGVGLSLVNRWGKLRGRLVPATGKNIILRRQQYARGQDPAFCLEIGRQIVSGKLRNARNLARRMARGREQVEARWIERIVAALEGAERADDLATLRGLEGAAAKAYFAVLRQSFQHDLGFARRVRRPPKDPINALLSLGYSLLTQNLMTACEVVGLDPYEGFFHADKYGRPALALDLVEEWRGIIVDSVALSLVNRERLAADDFTAGAAGAVNLSQPGLRTFFQAYTARLNTLVKHPGTGRRISYQKLFEVQARGMRNVIEGKADRYEPWLTR